MSRYDAGGNPLKAQINSSGDLQLMLTNFNNAQDCSLPITVDLPVKIIRRCEFTVTRKVQSRTCQVLLLFEEFDLLGPVNGDCGNDSLIITGAKPGTSPPVLCGYNTGQHNGLTPRSRYSHSSTVYLNVDHSSGPVNLNMVLSSLPYNRDWKIRVIFVGPCDECKAPSRCLQYFRKPSGVVTSFNYKPGAGSMLNNQAYAICFADCPGYCDVGLTFSDFSLGNTIGACAGDYLGIGFSQFCGDTSGLTITLNATFPAIIGVLSDDNNDFLDNGFSLNYMHMPC
ncbi:uncharacterized protein LOC143028859 [Oratosquilla oratoria]|uniref:uncharacterized protein LOC143028859 n=1 Tax=Oratosquilla oratoria TaxID=337810 RepID=UPI003F770117